MASNQPFQVARANVLPSPEFRGVEYYEDATIGSPALTRIYKDGSKPREFTGLTDMETFDDWVEDVKDWLKSPRSGQIPLPPINHTDAVVPVPQKVANTPAGNGVLARTTSSADLAASTTYLHNLLAFCIDQLGGSLVLDAVDVTKISDGKWQLEVFERKDPYAIVYKVKEVK